MITLKKPRFENVMVTLIFFVGVVFRLPYLNQGLPPYMACDEGFFANDVFRMFFDPSIEMKEFRSGAMNSWPVIPFAGFLYIIGELTYSNLVILGRLLLPIVLASATVYPLHKVLKRLGVSNPISLLTNSLFAISPFVVSQSEIWYPDSYIMFVSALFILQFIKLIQSRNTAIARSNYLMALFAIGVSVKHNFAFFILTILLFELSRMATKSKKTNSLFANIRILFKRYFSFVVKSIALFSLINFSIFFNFLDFLRAINSNRKIYAVQDFNFIPGTIFYLYNLVLSPLGIIGMIFFAIGVVYYFGKERHLTIALIGSVLIFIIAAGFPKQALARNINQLLPIFFIFFSVGVQKLQETRKPLFLAFFGILLSLSLIRSEISFYSIILKPDSYSITENWLKQNLKGQIIGVNNGCNGPSPAFISGSSVRNVKDTSDQLDYYLFSSYGEGPFFDFYRQRNVYSSGNPRYLGSYYFNDTRILTGWSAPRSLSTYVPDGYKMIKQFSGSGPTFVLLEKVSRS
jgi:hypothetical protein